MLPTELLGQTSQLTVVSDNRITFKMTSSVTGFVTVTNPAESAISGRITVASP